MTFPQRAAVSSPPGAGRVILVNGKGGIFCCLWRCQKKPNKWHLSWFLFLLGVLSSYTLMSLFFTNFGTVFLLYILLVWLPTFYLFIFLPQILVILAFCYHHCLLYSRSPLDFVSLYESLKTSCLQGSFIIKYLSITKHPYMGI